MSKRRHMGLSDRFVSRSPSICAYNLVVLAQTVHDKFHPEPSEASLAVLSKRNTITCSLNAVVDVRRRRLLFGISRKLLELANSKFTKRCPRQSLQALFLYRKQRHHLLLVGSRSHRRVHFGSCSGRDWLITVQSISKRCRQTATENVIQGLYLVL